MWMEFLSNRLYEKNRSLLLYWIYPGINIYLSRTQNIWIHTNSVDFHWIQSNKMGKRIFFHVPCEWMKSALCLHMIKVRFESWIFQSYTNVSDGNLKKILNYFILSITLTKINLFLVLQSLEETVEKFKIDIQFIGRQ